MQFICRGRAPTAGPQGGPRLLHGVPIGHPPPFIRFIRWANCGSPFLPGVQGAEGCVDLCFCTIITRAQIE